jgi:hypothetical protein
MMLFSTKEEQQQVGIFRSVTGFTHYAEEDVNCRVQLENSSTVCIKVRKKKRYRIFIGYRT